jgi:26S proteasome regulatory subunit N11
VTERLSDDEDLLALSEEAEFEASVRAAQQRAASRAAAPPTSSTVSMQSTRSTGSTPSTAPAEDPLAGIEWQEQQDVYRPRRIDARTYMASVGAPDPLPVRPGQSLALLRRAAYETILEHLRTDVANELGGLLGGEALYDPTLEMFVVTVEAALPARNGDGTPTSFSYTPEAWEAILPEWRKMSRDWTIVGSYHSHPGMGVFLSSVDLATQADVFPHDWQVAMVVDPVSDACGLFIGASGKKCPFALR